MARSGQLAGTDLLWKEGLKDPVSAIEMIGLLLALPEQPPPPVVEKPHSGVMAGDRLPHGNLPSPPPTRARDSLFSFRGRIGRRRRHLGDHAAAGQGHQRAEWQ